MRMFLLILAFCCATSAFGQLPQRIVNTLATKHVAALNQFLTKQPAQNKYIEVHWKLQRDLTPTFNENVVYIEKSTQDEDDPNNFSVDRYRIAFIANKNTVIYYRFSEEKNRKVNGNWVPYLADIAEYRNAIVYNIFEREFSQLFQASIKQDELFNETLVYGQRCGMDGIDPINRVKINELVKRNDKNSLCKWLHSINTEKQLYAIDGLYQLTKKGAKISSQELKIIKFVLTKKGNVTTCSGCVGSSFPVSWLAKEFKF